jgi:hypothetical protein
VPQSAFVLPIVTRLHAAKTPILRKLLAEWQSSGVADLAMSVSTKIAMLSLLVGRLYASLSPLTTAIRDADLPMHLGSRKGLVIVDRNAPYAALLEFDAFIYEFRSAYEILGKFICAVFDRLGRRIAEKDIVNELVSRGVDMTWAKELQEHRKIFFHERAAWLAVNIKSVETSDFEFVVLTDPGADPSNPDEAVSFDRLHAIYNGMDASLKHIQSWVLEELARMDQ